MKTNGRSQCVYTCLKGKAEGWRNRWMAGVLLQSAVYEAFPGACGAIPVPYAIGLICVWYCLCKLNIYWLKVGRKAWRVWMWMGFLYRHVMRWKLELWSQWFRKTWQGWNILLGNRFVSEYWWNSTVVHWYIPDSVEIRILRGGTEKALCQWAWMKLGLHHAHTW